MRTGTIVAVGFLVVLASVAGVGLILGTGSGDQGQSGAAAPTATDGQAASTEPGPEATPIAPETATPAPTQPTATPSPEDDQSDSARVNRSQLVTAIETELNADRSFNNKFSTDSTTAARLASMAQAHSQDMADQQFLSHNVGNGNSEARYKRNDLYGQCEFQKDNYIVDASNNQLEVIGRVSVDAYANGGAGTLEERLADALVSDWKTTPRYDERISYENADAVGVGVAVSSDGDLYATADLC